MILNIGIGVLLAWGFYRGFHRGLVLQFCLTVGYLVVWLAARFGARPLAEGLSQFVGNLSLDSSLSLVTASQSSHFFLNGLAFSAILTVGYFLVRRIARGLNRITWLPVIHQVNSLVGGLINVMIRYVIIFLALNLLILLPVTSFQTAYQASDVAQWIVKKTPGLSHQIYDWWVLKQ